MLSQGQRIGTGRFYTLKKPSQIEIRIVDDFVGTVNDDMPMQWIFKFIIVVLSIIDQ